MVQAPLRVTGRERRALRQIWDASTESVRARKRAWIVLLSASGEGAERIASLVGWSVRAVRGVRSRWRTKGVAGLRDLPRSGRPPRVTASYRAKMLWAVERDPRSLGFAFSRWTAPRLAEYLRLETGIGVTGLWLAELLRTHGYVWRRTKRTLRNLQDPAAVKRAARRIRRLKRGLWTPRRTSSFGLATVSASTSFPS